MINSSINTITAVVPAGVQTQSQEPCPHQHPPCCCHCVPWRWLSCCRRESSWPRVLIIWAYIALWEYFSVLVTQPSSTLCNSIDCSLPGSSGPGILQARMPKWVVIPFSRKPSKIFLKDYLAFLILQIFLLWYIHVCFATHLCLFCELSSAFSAYRARSLPSFFFFLV